MYAELRYVRARVTGKSARTPSGSSAPVACGSAGTRASAGSTPLLAATAVSEAALTTKDLRERLMENIADGVVQKVPPPAWRRLLPPRARPGRPLPGSPTSRRNGHLGAFWPHPHLTLMKPIGFAASIAYFG